MRVLLVLFVAVGVASGQSPPAVEGSNGMVVAVCPIAAAVGVEVLKSGGNAVDAAVAVALAEAVTWPEAGNIGGGGFMLVWPNDGRPATFFDYRETAPAAATADLFADGTRTWSSHQSVGIPGTVRGLELAHKRLGTKPWKDLVRPAVNLAAEGFLVDEPLAKRLNDVLADKKTTNAEFRRLMSSPTGKPWLAGERFRQPELGRTLTAIAEQGPDAFYLGETADRLVAEMKAHGNWITKTDLASYRAKERTPLRGTYRGFEVIGAPPPSSGGTAVIQALNMLETFDLKAFPRHSAETMHRLAEVQRRVFCDRARHLGDPDFTSIPPHLLSKDYARKLAAGITPTATKSTALAPDIEIHPGGDSTTHFSIIDKSGMCVSNTYTLENNFGSRIGVPGAGYLLNNEMTDFNTHPGRTTANGGIGTTPNTAAPGKRMLSSMTPTIVLKDGKPYLVTGSPGGRTIINTVLCVLVNVLDYDMDPQTAVDAPRQHHQWLPDRLTVETFANLSTVKSALEAKGHTVKVSRQGDAHTIRIDPKTGTYQGAADRRLNGRAVGY